jgi:predicted RNase H-like nuclease (RuvC/YqgF family)
LVNIMSSRPSLLARMMQAVSRRRQPVQVPVQVQPVGPAVARVPLSADAQWARLNTVIVRSLDRAQDISSHHAQARDQLDAAAYAFQLLLADLGTVMQFPGRALLAAASTAAEPDFALAA